MIPIDSIKSKKLNLLFASAILTTTFTTKCNTLFKHFILMFKEIFYITEGHSLTIWWGRGTTFPQIAKNLTEKDFLTPNTYCFGKKKLFNLKSSKPERKSKRNLM